MPHPRALINPAAMAAAALLFLFPAGARASDLSSWEVETMCAGIEQVYRSLMDRRHG